MKKAAVIRDKSGYWKVVCDDTGSQVGRLHDTEGDAIRAANTDGYIVV